MTPAAALAAILEMLPLVGIALALYAHYRADNAEARTSFTSERLAQTRMQLFELIQTIEGWAWDPEKPVRAELAMRLVEDNPELFETTTRLRAMAPPRRERAS